MTPKEIVALFRDAPWRDPAEIEQLATSIGPLDVATIERLLEVLTKGSAGADAGRHRMRCQAFARLAGPTTDKALFALFVGALRQPDPLVRSTLCALIPNVNDVGSHEHLSGLLRSAEAELRVTAARLLGELGGHRAFESVAGMVAEPSFEGRVEGMEALRAMGGHRAVPALESVLAVGTVGEKIRAIKHLVSPACRARDATVAVESVAKALGDSAEAVQFEAIAALAAHASCDQYFTHVGPFFAHPSPHHVRAAVLGLRAFRSPRSIEALRTAIKRGPNLVRFAVLEILEAHGSPEAVEAIVDALGHRQLPVRVRASQALVRLARAGTVDLARTVLWLLRSRDVNVRRLAVEVAASVADPAGELWPRLLAYLYDEDWWVRERVMDTLVDMAGEQLVPPLLQHLRDDADPSRRYHTVELLKRLRSPSAVGALAQVAGTDTDWLVRERAIEAIAALRDEQVVPILTNLLIQCPEQRLVCVQAIQDVGSSSAAPQISALLQAESLPADERLAVLRCLQAIDGRSEIAVVRQHLSDSSPDVRMLAERILKQWELTLGSQPGWTPRVKGGILDQLLSAMVEWQGDDLLLCPGRPPFLKRAGQVHSIAKNALTREQIEACLSPLLTPAQVDELDGLHDVDFSYERGETRFRVNVFQQMGGLGAVFRIVRGTLPRLSDLGLPEIVQGLGDLRNGLVLIGGPTGSGKSTTLAALIHHINETSSRHVVTLEDPIETVHRRQRGVVNQRELGTHTASLADALRATLRQDPDVILVGELRDYPTVAFAVTAAETGHLVFGTVHTVSAATSVDRLINACPPAQHDHMRTLLAGSLKAVVCQYLHKRANGPGRVLSAEIMLVNDAIASLIRKGKAFQIPSMMTTSRAQGMQLMDVDLMRLYQEGAISGEDAYIHAVSKKDFERAVGGTGGPSAGAES